MNFNFAGSLAVTLAAGFLVGCGADPGSSPDGAINEPPPGTAHAHPSEGPHHGELIELGNEAYHAELLHDDKSVTIYILDSAAKAAVPIDAAEVMINVQHDGMPEQFALSASPDEGDPEGKSSRFVTQDAGLATHLEEEGAQARLAVKIDGQQFNGAIVHDHDHDHGHAH